MKATTDPYLFVTHEERNKECNGHQCATKVHEPDSGIFPDLQTSELPTPSMQKLELNIRRNLGRLFPSLPYPTGLKDLLTIPCESNLDRRVVHGTGIGIEFPGLTIRREGG